MNLRAGEYLIVSSCIKVPYTVKNLISLISKLQLFDVQFGGANFLNIAPEEANFEMLWNGVDEVALDTFTIEDLECYFLSSLEIRFNDDIHARLDINFLDEYSYEVSIIFNYTELIAEESSFEKTLERSKFVEDVGIVLFEEMDPLYGCIGVERSVCGIKAIRNRECNFPSDRAYYSPQLYNKDLRLFKDIVSRSSFFHELGNGGCYFRKTELNNYNLLESNDENDLFYKLIQYL
ncbi:hypothetical protein ACFO25_19520 [Paenactinomyces guangxiensis]|uniref:Uncharacterized protein n=1 Tax=Paenactinomyces guangxiensis TaxID=1490290 RepID=A0A7W1WT04_9BACL|nr:hypothetical protein [Paenactinomyces guangxiensis]MBA4495504.1 hypothetical protein [Paenactinomyces guangxiensis]MBH8593647.1 hypothetical protein [Paenactinomyces guangxiensis]